jgi:uncharacterized membrane protein YqgA involved in biofilm formation
MFGLGTLINTAAVVFGGLLGLLLKNGIAKKYESILMKSLGLATIFIGTSGVLRYMLVIEGTTLNTQGTMLLIFSLVFGCLIGQWIDLEAKMEHIGIKLKNAVKVKNDNHFVEGFVTTSLIICVGAMAIVGAMQDGLSGDSSMLIAKSMLDFAIVTKTATSEGLIEKIF